MLEVHQAHRGPLKKLDVFFGDLEFPSEKDFFSSKGESQYENATRMFESYVAKMPDTRLTSSNAIQFLYRLQYPYMAGLIERNRVPELLSTTPGLLEVLSTYPLQELDQSDAFCLREIIHTLDVVYASGRFHEETLDIMKQFSTYINTRENDYKNLNTRISLEKNIVKKEGLYDSWLSHHFFFMWFDYYQKQNHYFDNDGEVPKWAYTVNEALDLSLRSNLDTQESVKKVGNTMLLVMTKYRDIALFFNHLYAYCPRMTTL